MNWNDLCPCQHLQLSSTGCFCNYPVITAIPLIIVIFLFYTWSFTNGLITLTPPPPPQKRVCPRGVVFIERIEASERNSFRIAFISSIETWLWMARFCSSVTPLSQFGINLGCICIYGMDLNMLVDRCHRSNDNGNTLNINNVFFRHFMSIR